MSTDYKYTLPHPTKQIELTMKGFTGTGGEALQPPLKKGFLLPNRSLVVELWNGFLLFTLLLSSEKKKVFEKNIWSHNTLSYYLIKEYTPECTVGEEVPTPQTGDAANTLNSENKCQFMRL